MGYDAKVILDSVSPGGVRLTTLELTYPRFVHSEFMTHRVFSRNAASSRAIPIEKMLERVRLDPVEPVWWGKNQPGMQAKEELHGDDWQRASAAWLEARDAALAHAASLQALGVHKQLVNRLLEPWSWITVLVTATDWENFFALRCHPDAQPELQHVARLARVMIQESDPAPLAMGEWHLPLVRGVDFERENLAGGEAAWIKICVGRCARISYLTHDGKRDLRQDIRLHDQLLKAGHMSPFEHAATPLRDTQVRSGNFRGWLQYRKLIPGEDLFRG